MSRLRRNAGTPAEEEVTFPHNPQGFEQHSFIPIPLDMQALNSGRVEYPHGQRGQGVLFCSLFWFYFFSSQGILPSSIQGASFVPQSREFYVAERKRLAAELWDFRMKLKQTGDPAKKLVLFQIMASEIYQVAPPDRLRTYRMRMEFDFQRMIDLWRMQRCIIDPRHRMPTIFHHVVLLKHGGTNHRLNVVSICNACHEEIHPWLREFAPLQTEGGMPA